MPTNEQITFSARETVTIEERPVPEPSSNEVLIETACTLISTGTELSNLTNQTGNTEYPFYPGYNNVGTIIAVGTDVDEGLLGQRVGSYGGHANYVLASVPNQTTSAFQTYVPNQTTSAFQTYRSIPESVADDEAVFFTIAEIVMNGVRRGGVEWGETVVIFGMGLLGQFAARICRFAGARPVVAVDIDPKRLEWLPDVTGITSIDASDGEYLASLQSVTDGALADVVFELTGNPSAIPDEFDALREQGRLVILSSPRGETQFNFNQQCSLHSYRIIGAHNSSHPSVATPTNPWTQARHAELFFDLVADGEFETAPLISHRRPYTDAPDIYESLRSDRSQAMGIVFEW